jgi:hypothetical protein
MKKTCLNCGLAQWMKIGNRRILSHGGICQKEINIPHSYEDYRGDMPARGYISKYTKSDCPCWEKIGKNHDG